MLKSNFVRKLTRLVCVLFIVTAGTLLLIDLVPGDPAYTILGQNATPEQVAQVHSQLGTNKPFPQRYAHWVSGIVHGRFGTDIQNGQDVFKEIRTRLPVTLELALISLTVALAVSIPLGVITAYRADKALDKTWSVASSVLISTPVFVSGLLLSYLFAVRWRLLPVTGWVPLTENLGQNLRHALLPAISLSLFEIPVFTRLLRAGLLSTLQEDFVLAARARGLSTRYVLLRHALRPSSFSLLTLSGLSLGRLFGGTIIVESIFALPGIGNLMFDAILAKSLVVVQGVVLFMALVYVLVNASVDAAYGLLDPRVRARRLLG